MQVVRFEQRKRSGGSAAAHCHSNIPALHTSNEDFRDGKVTYPIEGRRPYVQIRQYFRDVQDPDRY